MTAIRMVLMKDRPTGDGRYPVYLRVSDRGKRLHIATGFDASEKEFIEGKEEGHFAQGKGVPKFVVERKENGRIVKYENREANAELVSIEAKIRDFIDEHSREGKGWTMEELKMAMVKKHAHNSFLLFARDIIKTEYRGKNAFQRATIVEDAIASFEKYDKSLSKKMFEDITPKYIQGYKNFWTKRGVSTATIAMRLREIRRIYNIAIRDAVVSQDSYPFSRSKEDRGVKIPKNEIKKADQYLTKESLQKLASVELDKKILDKTRHLFLFSLFCRGINWKDMAFLTNDNIVNATVTDNTTKQEHQVKMLCYTRSKTKGKFNIQITPKIQNELDWFRGNTKQYGDYLLPIILEAVSPENLDKYLKQSRRRYNRYLKDLAKAAGLPEGQQEISIYTARHSFAMAMQNENKSVEIISQALGHQSVETTKHYLAKFSTTKMAEECDIDL